MLSENLSRRAVVRGAAAVPAVAALPALAVPAAVVPADASTAVPASACTLPPDLIERFVRLRAWYVDYREREELWSNEIDRRFHATTGLTDDQWRASHHDDPRWEELVAVREKILAEVPSSDIRESESDELCEERWNVTRALIGHKPQTVVDLAWQAEAYLIADLEILSSSGNTDRLLRMLFRHIRTLGALPQPDDPLGTLSIDIDSDDGAEA